MKKNREGKKPVRGPILIRFPKFSLFTTTRPEALYERREWVSDNGEKHWESFSQVYEGPEPPNGNWEVNDKGYWRVYTPEGGTVTEDVGEFVEVTDLEALESIVALAMAGDEVALSAVNNSEEAQELFWAATKKLGETPKEDAVEEVTPTQESEEPLDVGMDHPDFRAVVEVQDPEPPLPVVEVREDVLVVLNEAYETGTVVLVEYMNQTGKNKGKVAAYYMKVLGPITERVLHYNATHHQGLPNASLVRYIESWKIEGFMRAFLSPDFKMPVIASSLAGFGKYPVLIRPITTTSQVKGKPYWVSEKAAEEPVKSGNWEVVPLS